MPILRVPTPDPRKAPKGFVLTEYAFGFKASKAVREEMGESCMLIQRGPASP